MNKRIVLLGGNSNENKDWIERISRSLPFPTHTVIYEHWKNNASLINLNVEAAKLEKLAPSVVFAKSAGILVTLKAIKERKISPTYCIFAGVPLHWSTKNKLPLQEWLTGFSAPARFIQNSNDPACSAEELRTLLTECKVKNPKLTVLRAETHDYPVEEIAKAIKEYLRV